MDSVRTSNRPLGFGFQALQSRTLFSEKPRIAADALLTESGFNGNSLAAFSAAPGDDCASALGFHTSAKTVRLRTTATVRLECALRHEESRAPILTNCFGVNLLKGQYKRRLTAR